MPCRYWGPAAAAVLEQYPLASYASVASAYIQADADYALTCPSQVAGVPGSE